MGLSGTLIPYVEKECEIGEQSENKEEINIIGTLLIFRPNDERVEEFDAK